MRKIEFRLWDNDFKTYDSYHLKHITLNRIYEHKNRFNFEQFIGLKDKNGIKIFVNDVLQDGLGEKMLVTYEEQTASFIMIDEDMGYSFDKNEMSRLKVIGNINENPELVSNSNSN